MFPRDKFSQKAEVFLAMFLSMRDMNLSFSSKKYSIPPYQTTSFANPSLKFLETHPQPCHYCRYSWNTINGFLSNGNLMWPHSREYWDNSDYISTRCFIRIPWCLLSSLKSFFSTYSDKPSNIYMFPFSIILRQCRSLILKSFSFHSN